MWNASTMGDRQELVGWWRYAWANHAWETTVSTVLAGPWLLALATHHRPDSSTLIRIGALHLRADSYPSLVVTIAAFGQLLILPWLGASADRGDHHARWLRRSCICGAVLAAALALTSGGDYLAAGTIFFVGSIFYGTSDLLYNSYLPRLTEPQERDDVSSRGYAYGYVGGGLLLAANLLLLLLHKRIGIDKSVAVRICFVSAGIWWAAFGVSAIRQFARVPSRRSDEQSRPGVVAVLRGMRATPETRRFLIAYLLFSDAITAVIGLSSTFITHELFHGSATKASTFLFSLILAIQFIAMVGAIGFARLARRISTKRVILLSLAIWIAVIVYAYAGLHSKPTAVVAGVVIGVVLGGSQALSRSLWSQLIPAGAEATYFGFFAVTTKGTSWIAPLLFTIVVNATGSYRQAILSLIVLFVAGAALLAATDVDAAIAEAGR
jgi:UMF1 family MFS transporter